MKVIVVRGNIGRGKTTIIKMLVRYYTQRGVKCYMFLEPVEEWDCYLKDFYQNPSSTTAYNIQLSCFFSFFRLTNTLSQLSESDPDCVVFVERSPEDSKSIFIENLRHVLLPTQLSSLHTFCDHLSSNSVWSSAIILYLSPLPIDTLIKQIEHRNRSSECSSGISKEYLESLDTLHEILHDKITREYRKGLTKNESHKITTENIDIQDSSSLEKCEIINIINNIIFYSLCL